MSEHSFEPRPGPPRDTQTNSPRTVSRIVKSAARQGRQPKRKSFTPGALDRRGGGFGALSHARPPGTRRVIVRARIARHLTPDLAAASAHLRYIQRDGVTREGERGQLYDRDSDDADGRAFLDRSTGERHQFRFTVSPEDSHHLEDLKPFIRDLMQRMERDLDTSLDWVAVDHFNTGHPHTHIVVRGRTDQDKDLVIARSYISHGIRRRAEQLVSMELGLETELERIAGLQREVTKQRFTRLDRAILSTAKENVLALEASPQMRTTMALRQARLRTLERLGLANEERTGVWSLDADIERKLGDMGDRFDRIKTIDRVIAENNLNRAETRFSIFDNGTTQKQVFGRVLGTGPVDELTERRYVVLDGIDGRVHYAEFMSKPHVQPVEREQIIGLSRPQSRGNGRTSANITITSSVALPKLVRYDGPTWLDRLIVSTSQPTIHQAGFGLEVERELANRRQWLVTNGHARQRAAGGINVRARLLDQLADQEAKRVGARLAQQLDSTYRPISKGQAITGVYERSVTVPGGRLAVISRPDGFALVRWQPSLERYRGKHVNGIAHARSVSWQLGRARNLSPMR